MKRRFLAILFAAAVFHPGALVAPTASTGVGLLRPREAIPNTSPNGAAFVRGLAEQGYLLEQNLLIESRFVLGRMDNVSRLVQELVAAKVHVIVSMGFPAALAAKRAGLPTVAACGVGDPVATGVVNSLAQPRGNFTGISEFATELSTKRLSLLREAVPGLRRVAMLWNNNYLGMTLHYQAAAKVAGTLGVAVQALGVQEPNDFVMERERPDAILIVADNLAFLNRKRIFDFAAAHRLPAIYELDAYACEGGLMSYGPDTTECFERAAALVGRILQGASCATLPFEEPTRYVLVVNLKAAKVIGLDLPPSILASADEVIE